MLPFQGLVDLNQDCRRMYPSDVAAMGLNQSSFLLGRHLASDIEAKELQARIGVAVSQRVLFWVKATKKFLDAGSSEEA